MARSGRPCVIPTFLDFPVDTCLHMVMSILALHAVLSDFSGHLGFDRLVSVDKGEAEDVAMGLLPLLRTVDVSVYFDDEVPQYQVLYRHMRPMEEPPAPKAYSAWEVAGESMQSLIWRSLDAMYSKTALQSMLNAVFAVLTYSDRKLRLEPRAVIKLNLEGYPQVEDGLACLVTFNIQRRILG